MSLKKISQIWNYFKKGRGEIGLILSLYSMMLSYSIKFNVDFSILQYAVITLIFGIACTFLGVFLAKKVEPENNRISPYAQDNLNSAIYLQRALVCHFENDNEGGTYWMKKAIELRKKWLM